MNESRLDTVFIFFLNQLWLLIVILFNLPVLFNNYDTHN